MIKSRNIVIISNISVELLFLPIVKKNFLEENGNIVVTAISYEEYRGKEFLEDLKDIDIIIVWLNLEVLIPEIHNGDPDCIYSGRKERYIKKLCGDLAEQILLCPNAKIFWLSFEDFFLHLPVVTGCRNNLFVMGLNQRLQESLSKQITFMI